MNATFYFREGSLWWRDWCWGDDNWARGRMERIGEQFECLSDIDSRELAQECRQALSDFDAFWMEHIDA